mmetsp:Transcript_7966/g.18440  ORF Transcript_7966/g.18440 Transcript_7966/m.18440 type:complete len:133 (+) Transcript_7966:98-496(+)
MCPSTMNRGSANTLVPLWKQNRQRVFVPGRPCQPDSGGHWPVVIIMNNSTTTNSANTYPTHRFNAYRELLDKVSPHSAPLSQDPVCLQSRNSLCQSRAIRTGHLREDKSEYLPTTHQSLCSESCYSPKPKAS